MSHSHRLQGLLPQPFQFFFFIFQAQSIHRKITPFLIKIFTSSKRSTKNFVSRTWRIIASVYEEDNLFMAMSFGSCFGARSRAPEMVSSECSLRNYNSLLPNWPRFQLMIIYVRRLKLCNLHGYIINQLFWNTQHIQDRDLFDRYMSNFKESSATVSVECFTLVSGNIMTVWYQILWQILSMFRTFPFLESVANLYLFGAKCWVNSVICRNFTFIIYRYK